MISSSSSRRTGEPAFGHRDARTMVAWVASRNRSPRLCCLSSYKFQACSRSVSTIRGSRYEGSRVALGAAFGEPLLDLVPGERACLAGIEHRCAALGLDRPQLVDLGLVGRVVVQTRE